MLGTSSRYPSRIVCLTEETTETLYRLGLDELIVGVSGFTVRPPQARKKPKVSSFLDADFEQIVALKPDLVLGFSDLQATLGAELAKRGVPVMVFNQRSLSEILQTIRVIGALVGASTKAEALADELQRGLEVLANENAALSKRPRIFFEEWHEPLISGIRWCSELVELMGGEDICAECRTEQAPRAASTPLRRSLDETPTPSSRAGVAARRRETRLSRGPAGRRCARSSTISSTK